jgi:hypothetical protein
LQACTLQEQRFFPGSSERFHSRTSMLSKKVATRKESDSS